MKNKLLLTFNRVAESAVGGEKCANTPPVGISVASYRVVAVIFMFCMLGIGSMWADDATVKEDYGMLTNVSTLATNSGLHFQGIYGGTWDYRYLMSSTTKDAETKLGTDRAVLMDRTGLKNDKAPYVQCTTWEGGIKKVSFKYQQTNAEDDGQLIKLQVRVERGGNSYNDDISFTGDAAHRSSATTYNSTSTIDAKVSSCKLKVYNWSQVSAEDNTVAAGRCLVGPITITPYLLYKQKEVTVGSKQRNYCNGELINNTGDEGSIEYSSNNTSVATVDSETGVITPVSAGDAVITATWSEGVTTTYTLHVVDGIVVENFSKVKQTTASSATPNAGNWEGDLFAWTAVACRRGTGDTISANPRKQVTWLANNNTPSSLTTTAAVEGGVKHLKFNWREWSVSKNTTTKIAITYGEDEKTAATQIQGNLVSITGHTYDEDINGASNAALKIENSSFTTSTNTAVNNRFVIENIQITPYLLYTTKEAMLDMRVASPNPTMTYTNTDLINNTGATPGYSILPSENNIAAGVFTNGQVSIADRFQTGDITIQAAWSGVTTTYILHVYGKSRSDASFSEPVVYKYADDDTFTMAVSKADGSPNASYSSSDGNVATVDASTGEVTIQGLGQTTITATIDETADYGGSSASYVLYVVESVTERFSDVPNVDTGSDPATSSVNGYDWKGDLCDWTVTNIRRGGSNSTDDHIDYDDQEMQSCWLSKSSDTNYGKLETTNWEGGIKAVYFRWAQYGSEGGNRLALKVEAGTLVDDSLSNPEKLLRFQQSKNRETGGIEYMHSFEYKSNGQFSITNISKKGGNNNCRILVGDITIIPYIYYRTKTAYIPLNSSDYVNNDLIQNIGGEGGTLRYSSANTNIATVDEYTGVVTGEANGSTEIIATYTWPENGGEVSTRYTVHVIQSSTETFSDYSTNWTTVANGDWNGDICQWSVYQVRRKAENNTDLINGALANFLKYDKKNSRWSYMTTTNWEGGIKAVSFKYARYGSEYSEETGKEVSGRTLKLKITAGEEAPHEVSHPDNTLADKGTGADYNHTFNCKTNGQLRIENSSTAENDATTDNLCRILVGDVTITPYIGYARKSVSITPSTSNFKNTLIDNTFGEQGTLSFESLNTAVADVNENSGIIDPHATGVAIIKATFTWDEGGYAVSATYKLHVVDALTWTEDYSKFPSRGMQEEMITDPGVYLDWYYRFARSRNEEGKHDYITGTTRGVWTNHYNRNTEENKATYLGCETEGGIKHVYFQWRQYTKDDNGDQLYLTVNAGGEEKYSIKPEKKNDNTYVNNLQTVDEEFEVKENVDFRIFNISTTDRDITTNKDIGRIIIGPVTITPYIFYLEREKSIMTGETYINPMIDNTDGEGTVTYSLISPSTAGAATINAKTGEVTTSTPGTVTVKALWSEGAYTTYTLHIVDVILEDEADNSDVIEAKDGQTVGVLLKDRTIRTGGYNTLCLPFDVSEETLQATLPGAKAYEFTNAYLSETNLDIRFDKVTELEAGKPYLVTVPADVANPVFESVTIDKSTTNNILTGENMRFIGSFNAGTMNETGLYVVANNLYRVASASDQTIGACRAYFDVLAGEPALGPVRMRIVAETNTATDIDEVNSEELRVKKMLINGQIFIIREGKMYNAQGQAVK